ncbi:MAG: MerR family transcriptional regulator [Dehalococcoidia bacterium]|nr:MerR family transcriptional regulator [Dehalococcoidia bacterium]
MKNKDLISISEASQILGVNEATLRQWTDEGKLNAFVTPGGHRRYSKSDLRNLTRSGQKVLGIKDLVNELEDTTPRHREIARGFFERSPQIIKPCREHQQQLAELGRHLLNLTARYVSEPARRAECLSAARDTGRSFGRLLAEMGMPLTETTEAFLMHRELIMQAAAGLAGKRQARGGRIAEAIPLANRLIDVTLVAMIDEHQKNAGKGAGRL